MKFGVHIFPTETSIQPAEFARAAEERGFDSAWFSEHTHIPVSFLESGVRQLPDYYWQTYDPFISCTLAAAATEEIKIGTGVSLVLEHDPISLAKSVATLDQVSGGRFIFGVGPGWLAGEMENHGVRYPVRYRMVGDSLSAMKAIWSQSEAQFKGDFVNFEPIKAYPKPLQAPWPPIIGGGGTGPRSLEFISRHCDGWMPILGRIEWPDIKAGIDRLRSGQVLPDQEPPGLHYSIFCWSLPDAASLADMQSSGLDRVVLSLEAHPQANALSLMDDYAKLVDLFAKSTH